MKTLTEFIAHFRPRAKLIRALYVASLAFGASPCAQAQNRPDQPIRIVTPYAPGFGFDMTMSRITPELSKLLGQTVRVEHHPIAPEQAALDAVAAPATASEPASGTAPEARTFMFTLWTPKQFSIAPGVRVSYEPVSQFVPVLRIDPGNDAASAAAPVQYVGFIAAAGTTRGLISQFREATFKVLAKDTLKGWTEVNGARVALIDGPGYTRFLETQWAHLKKMPDLAQTNSASLK